MNRFLPDTEGECVCACVSLCLHKHTYMQETIQCQCPIWFDLPVSPIPLIEFEVAHMCQAPPSIILLWPEGVSQIKVLD